MRQGCGAEIKVRAEIRAGQILAKMTKNVGAVPGKTGSKGKPVLDTTPTLTDLKITRKHDGALHASMSGTR